MDEGKFEPQLAWVAPAHKPNPFELIPAVKYKDSSVPAPGDDQENASGNGAQAAENADMANPGDAPDVEPDADAQGKVQNARTAKRALRALPVATPAPQRPRSFFERMFNVRPRPAAPTPIPTKRARPAF